LETKNELPPVTDQFQSLVEQKIAAGAAAGSGNSSGKPSISTRYKKSARKKPVRGKTTKKAPPKTAPPPEPEFGPFELTPKPMCMVIAGLIPFQIIAMLTASNKWELNEQEKETLAPYWDDVINKYIPTIAEEYGPEAALIVAMAPLVVVKSGILEQKPEKDLKNDSHGEK